MIDEKSYGVSITRPWHITEHFNYVEYRNLGIRLADVNKVPKC